MTRPAPFARLLPSPARAETRSGFLDLSRVAAIRFPSRLPGAERAAGVIARRLRERTGSELDFENGGAPLSGRPRIAIRGGAPSAPPADARTVVAGTGEGFALRIASEGAEITAEGPRGLLYAAEALAQLAGPERRIPATQIEDFPALRRRGFLLDISRGRVPTLDSLRALIRLLARLRYNELLLYTEHTFRFPSHPEIGAGSGGYTGDEIRALDTFARRQGIELTPCLQTFGHMRRILEKPRYRDLAESGTLWSLAPEAPGTMPLLRDLLADYLPNFASGWAHLNCDEPVDLGRGRSAERARKEGLAAVFAGHVNQVAELARAHGKRPMIWSDFLADHPEALDRLDPDIVLCDWWYEPDHDFDRVRRFRDAGRSFLTGCGTSSWTSLFPRLDTALPNIRGHARAAREYGADGMIVTDWGDGGHFNLFSGSLAPIAVGAEAAWGDENRPESELRTAFSEHVVGDPSGFAGEFAFRLGRCHQTGFPHFNHSPLKTVFFETRLLRSHRIPEPGVLEATRRELDRLAAEAGQRGLPEAPVGTEWAWALDASRLAAERGRLALALRARTGPDAALAAELGSLADRQADLFRRFRDAWGASYRPEGRETAFGLHRAAIRALRRSARRVSRA